MKDMSIRVDKTGRVTLPKQVRERLAINPHDFLKIFVQGNQIILRPRREIAGFMKRGRALVFSASGKDLLENAVVEAVRVREHDRPTAAIRLHRPPS